MSLFAGAVFVQILCRNKVTEGLEQRARFARPVDTFLTADEVPEVVCTFAAF